MKFQFSSNKVLKSLIPDFYTWIIIILDSYLSKVNARLSVFDEPVSFENNEKFMKILKEMFAKKVVENSRALSPC